MMKIVISFLVGVILASSVGAGEVVQFAGMRFDGIDDFVSFGTNVNEALESSYVMEFTLEPEVNRRRQVFVSQGANSQIKVFINWLGSRFHPRPYLQAMVWTTTGIIFLVREVSFGEEIVVKLSVKGGKGMVAAELNVNGGVAIVERTGSLRTASAGPLTLGIRYKGTISEFILFSPFFTVSSK